MRKIILMLTLVFYLFQKVDAQGTSIQDPINAGAIGLGQTYTNSFNNVDYAVGLNWLAGDGIVYSFTVSSAGLVNISGCGSTLDTYLNLYDSEEYLIYSNDDNGPICAGTNASMQVYLEPGTYYVQIYPNYNSQDPGNIAITIGRNSVVNGANLANAISLGSVTECLGGNFTDIRDNSTSNGFGNDIGEASDDIYYSFSIASTSTVNISTSGSAIDTYLHLLDASGIPITVNDNNGPLAPGNAASIQQVLSPGLYYVIVEGAGSNAGSINTGITTVPTAPAPAGAYFSNAIDAGVIGQGIPFSHSAKVTDCYGNEIGDYGNDIFYKFTLTENAEVTISNCNSSNNLSYLYLLNSSGTEIIRAEYSGPMCSNYKASIKYTLAAGTYYVAAEIVIYPWLNLVTTISVNNSAACGPLAAVPSNGQNYVMVSSPMIPIEDEALLATANLCEVQQSIQYLDGFGRNLQSIQVKGSGDGSKDIVIPFAYDGFGREGKIFLPYVSTGTSGTFRANAISDVISYYSNQPLGLSVGFGTPFSEKVFEKSPMNRVLEQGAPGTDWQPVPNNTTGHTVKMEYGSNINDEVLQWSVIGSGATASSSYSANRLYKVIVKDENWTAGHEHTIEEFKDFEGRVVLKRSWQDNLTSLDTYYIYDDLGNLRYVLPRDFAFNI